VRIEALAGSPAEALANGLPVVPQPAPTALRDGEVVVAIRSASVGWVDLLMTSGQYQHMPPLPYTPGMEGAGEIVAAGPGVPATRVGERVLVDGLLVGPRSLGAYQDQGTFASYVQIPSEAALPIPGDLSFDEAAVLLAAFETAWHVVVVRGRLQAGETLLVNGATGATGLAAVQVAKALGARVIATGRSPEKLAVVASLGADAVVPVGKDEAGAPLPFRDAVKAANGGAAVDVVYDGVGGAIGAESLRCLRFGGRYLVVGWASTPDVAKGHGGRGAPNANQLPTNLILMKGLDVLGCPAAIATAMDPTIRPPRLASVLDWAARGVIRPHVSHVFPFSEVQDAMRAKWRGDVVGGCVLRL
jgi:NADPH2:quinone reductase